MSLARSYYSRRVGIGSTDEIMFEVNWTSSAPRVVVMNTIRLITDKVIPEFK